ncbi:hypothetical protein ASPZODRAFT_105275 [Penicilliopsis zonata CBS 506.65]|uniref:Bulb-type lectin domain-containing protein n=1 Tax=Penicilliopsis zonata CBS 506.65 TaxID=1073090 RepID=A0A1L9S5F7_9EURO|nr:hypothetical protein ASPZODRAFT_105275 [Penicilliopsis zonata CBS 506.65]OJJ42380.1 hypothetical protein ASPZODRAFT_105275 [Penicilliopsis zonata CBS 506.65]
MKPVIALTSSLAALATAASLPSKFTLVSSEDGSTLTTNGWQIYGHTDTTSELSILERTGTFVYYNASGDEEGLSVLTGVNSLAWLIQPGSEPIAGTTITSYGLTDDGYLALNGEQNFAFNTSLDGAQELWWIGDVSTIDPGFTIVQLEVQSA